MSAVRSLSLVAILLAGVTGTSASACTPSKPSASTDGGAPDATRLSVRAWIDSGVHAQADAGAAAVRDAGPPGDGRVDLLYMTRATIAVSSKVDNPKDFPEHLIDRNRSTAWNSKTGDLVGAWIAFRVPADATVNRIELIVGFDKVGKDGVDLFTANHRIKKVEVTRDGKAIGTFDLDPDKRDPQRIAVDGPGGEYKVKVLETVPGTKKEWRELTVSEFHVMGTTPRDERMGGEQPRVLVGSLDPRPRRAYSSYQAAMKGFHASPEKFCEAQMMYVDTSPPEYAREMGMGNEKRTPHCKPSPAKKVADKLKPPFLDASSVEFVTGYGTTRTYLLKTSKGWHLSAELGGEYFDDFSPGCPSLFSERRNESIEVASSHVPALLVRQLFQTYDAGGPDRITTRIVFVCRLEPDETLACDKGVGINELTVKYTMDGKEDLKAYQPWPPDVPFVVTPDGHIERKGDFVSSRDSSWTQY